uniref:Putative AAA family ATPase n=1 Tax=Moumouvirus sp. 'Monve' TaxID=1128131 RepID=H2EF78_9VIRU|nr:putative AAA family ATPase [Moumouvirus Monve]
MFCKFIINVATKEYINTCTIESTIGLPVLSFEIRPYCSACVCVNAFIINYYETNFLC